MLISRVLLCFAAITVSESKGQTSVEFPVVPSEAQGVWDVSLPEPLDGQESFDQNLPTPLVFSEVISSHSVSRSVPDSQTSGDTQEAADKGVLTIQLVKPPQLPASLPGPVAPLSNNLVVDEQFPVFEPNSNETKLIFVSASVYDNHRTLVRIYPNGRNGKEVVAWSNIDFNAFDALTGYRVNNSDGTWKDYGLLVGITNLQATASQPGGLEGEEDEDLRSNPPSLPDLAIGGPSYQILGGGGDNVALDTLQQIHDLFRKEGQRIVAASLARKQAEATQDANQSGHSPAPVHTTIRYWKGEKNAVGTEVEK